VDHLSRLTTDSRSDITPIDDYFPDECLFFVSIMPWFANFVNFLVSRQLPTHWSTQDKRKFLNKEKNFYWDDPYLFKYFKDAFLTMRCVGAISHQKRPLQKSYKVDFTGPPCSRTHMHSARLEKIVKSWDLFQNVI